MSRSVLILVPMLIGLMVANANAQSSKIGVTGGVNISNLNGISGASTKDGLIIGAFVEYDLVAGLSLEPEVLFSMKGAKWQSQTGAQGPFAPPVVNTTLNYVEIPILLKFKVLTFPVLPADIDVFAGPDFAFNVASKNEFTELGITTTSDESKNTYPFDFNIAVGAGPTVDLGPISIGAEVRYTFGTSPVFKNQTVGSVLSNSKNGVWSIMASVGF